MTTSLPFIDRIKVLYRGLIKGKRVALNRPRSYEVRILPSSVQRGQPLSGLLPIKLVATVATPRLSARSDRLWWDGSRRHVEHTRSNLG